MMAYSMVCSVDTIMNPSDGSFDGSSNDPPKGTLFGGPIEEAVCGA